MVYTNEILKTLEKEYENAEFEVEWDKEDGKESNINSNLFRNFLSTVELFYNNHKKGFVDDVEFEDGMITINKFLNLFKNTEIDYEPSARAIKYLFEVEKEEKIEAEENNKIKEFVENDNRDLLRVLFLNKDDEYEERYSFEDNFRILVEKDDKRIIAISKKNYDCIIDCCDNCDKECYNEETNEYYCEENQDKVDCAVENQIAEDYCDILL